MHARTLAFTVRDFLRFLCKWVKYCVVWNDFLWINHVNTYYPFLHLLCQPIPRFCNFNLLLFGIVYIDIPPLKNVINQRMRVVKLFWVIRNLAISNKKYEIFKSTEDVVNRIAWELRKMESRKKKHEHILSYEKILW